MGMKNTQTLYLINNAADGQPVTSY